MNTLESVETVETLESVIAERNALLAEVARLKGILPVEQWEPAEGIYFIDECGEVISASSTHATRQFGLERSDLGIAIRAAKEIRIHNRLLAYRDEFYPEYDKKNDRHYVYLMRDSNEFCSAQTEYDDLCVVYMSRKVAEELCAKLNSGEVVL